MIISKPDVRSDGGIQWSQVRVEVVFGNMNLPPQTGQEEWSTIGYPILREIDGDPLVPMALQFGGFCVIEANDEEWQQLQKWGEFHGVDVKRCE